MGKTGKSQAMTKEIKSTGDIYSLLSRVFLKEVDRPFLDLLKKEEYIDALKGSGFTFCDRLAGSEENSELDELAVEFAALFLISSGRTLSPYESVHASGGGQLCGKQASETLAFYRSAGFDFPKDSDIFPDHFAVELEFMAHLCRREADALQKGDEPQALEAKRLSGEFMNAHMGRWYGPFLKTVESVSSHPFYREMSSFAGRFIDGEMERC